MQTSRSISKINLKAPKSFHQQAFTFSKSKKETKKSTFPKTLHIFRSINLSKRTEHEKAIHHNTLKLLCKLEHKNFYSFFFCKTRNTQHIYKIVGLYHCI